VLLPISGAAEVRSNATIIIGVYFQRGIVSRRRISSSKWEITARIRRQIYSTDPPMPANSLSFNLRSPPPGRIMIRRFLPGARLHPRKISWLPQARRQASEFPRAIGYLIRAPSRMTTQFDIALVTSACTRMYVISGSDVGRGELLAIRSL
jgi:hypothetical protein